MSFALLAVYIPHTSASLLIQENASADVRRDLDAFLRRIDPFGAMPGVRTALAEIRPKSHRLLPLAAVR